MEACLQPQVSWRFFITKTSCNQLSQTSFHANLIFMCVCVCVCMYVCVCVCVRVIIYALQLKVDFEGLGKYIDIYTFCVRVYV